MFDGFEAALIDGDGAQIFVRHAGAGPALLLLHGFPETHLMWREIAPRLTRRFTVVCADLRGYGESSCPASDSDHAPYSKRVMARDMVAVMRRLGHARFAVAGHDRGARVAYRLALDHPAAVRRLAVLDAIPVAEAWDRADARLALAFWPWSLLAQPAPLPEALIAGAPDAIVLNASTSWGPASQTFRDELAGAYAAVLRNPAHAHAICEEYRAGAGIDRIHDRADRDAGRQIGCAVLALWSEAGGLAQWYDADGGPLGIWRRWTTTLTGRAMPGGHFFPEEHPALTAELLEAFFAAIDDHDRSGDG